MNRSRLGYPMGSEHKTTHRAIARRGIRDLEWAAGFLEGEGSFRFGTSSHHVDAVQVQREPLERLHKMFGGNLYLYDRLPSSLKLGHSPRHMWSTSGARARGVMMTLFTLMSPKRKLQIQRALAGKRGNRE